MPNIAPTMYDFINSPELYRRLDIMPAGWRKVEEETGTTKSLKSKLTTMKRRIRTKIRKLSQKYAPMLTFHNTVTGPLRERKVFEYADGYVLTLERAYETWEFTTPKPIAATPRIRPQQQSDADHKRESDRIGSRNDSMLVQDSRGLLRFDVEGGATILSPAQAEVFRAGETVSRVAPADENNIARLTGGVGVWASASNAATDTLKLCRSRALRSKTG